jgi:serine/threonine protein kinase
MAGADFNDVAAMMSGPSGGVKDSPTASPRSVACGTVMSKAGLLVKVAPSCTGELKRKTRFTRSWRNDREKFEVRCCLLVLCGKPSRKASGFGILDTMFGKGSGSSSTEEPKTSGQSASTSASPSQQETSVSSQSAPSSAAPAIPSSWSAVFDLKGCTVTEGTADEKAGAYPLKITFGPRATSLGEEATSDKTLGLCAASKEARDKWIEVITMASYHVDSSNFKLIKTIGRGQWGKVFLAHKISGTVAMKPSSQEKKEQEGDTEIIALKEVALSAKTNITHVQNERLIMQIVPPHEFIVNMQYAFRNQRLLYYALDFMDGGDLFRHWRQHRDKRGVMAPFYAAEVLLALEHLHKHKVIYRDLKPENVLLDSSGHTKLADLGLAKVLKNDGDRTVSFCGTEAYLAPEMILRVPYAASVDYWQYGCFVFELYAGRSPFWLPRKPRKFIRENILNGAFTYPSAVVDSVKPLVNELLQVNETVRMGSGRFDGWGNVRSHPFFADMDWEKLEAKEIEPPVIPSDPGSDLCNNFDEDFTSQRVEWGHASAVQGEPVSPFIEELLGFDFIRLPLVSSSQMIE